jgi:hypothetical protein
MMYLERIQNRRAKGNGGRLYPYGKQQLTPNELSQKAGSPFSTLRHYMTRYDLSPKEAVEKIRAKNARHKRTN